MAGGGKVHPESLDNIMILALSFIFCGTCNLELPLHGNVSSYCNDLGESQSIQTGGQIDGRKYTVREAALKKPRMWFHGSCAWGRR